MRWLVVAIAAVTIVVLGNPPAHSTPPPVPAKLAAAARYLAGHGGVTGTCHGCATARMQALSRRVVIARFAPAGVTAVARATCIVGAESGFNPGAISSTGDYGLLQANKVAHEPDFPWWWRPARGFRYLIFDPVYAAGAMWAMSARGTNWSAWTGTWGRGMCL